MFLFTPSTRKQISPRVLVTGAAGFIGSHVVEEFLASGWEVVAVDDLSTGFAAHLKRSARDERFVFEFADITEHGILSGLCARYRPNAIVHLAGLVSVERAESEPSENFRLNVESTHLVAEAARLHGASRIVFASSAAVYGDSPTLPANEGERTKPSNLYGMAKRASEEILGGYSESFGIETACLRFFNVYGPRQNPDSPYSGVLSIFAKRFREREPVTIFGDGTQTRDFISVTDVARAVFLATSTEGLRREILNVCTGKAASLVDIVSHFRSIFPESPAARFAPPRMGDILHSVGDPRRMRETTGFEATDSIENRLGELCQGTQLDPQRIERIIRKVPVRGTAPELA